MTTREQALEVLKRHQKWRMGCDETPPTEPKELTAAMNIAIGLLEQSAVDGNTSDGYHTFNELYEHRNTLFIALCNSHKDKAWKSKLHSDGTMFDDYFIAGIETEKGQATYHMHIQYWYDLEVKSLEKAPEWDGHTPEDVVHRIGFIEQSVDVESLKKSIPYDIEDEKKYSNCYLSNERARGYNQAIDDLVSRGYLRQPKADEGFVTVPKKPTIFMVDAYADDNSSYEDVYNAAIAAAPKIGGE